VLKASSLAVGAAFLLVGLAAAALVALIPVKASTRSELAPAAFGEWFAWTKSRENGRSPLDVWAQRGTEPAFKVNPRNTQGYTGALTATGWSTSSYSARTGRIFASTTSRRGATSASRAA
jgi:hypothetical protein